MDTSLETDYLVVGAGAAGMAFVDALIDADAEADVIVVDGRHAPGGHWLEAYPFVRLHQPSLYYGVPSTALGSETIDRYGPNAGFYEQASAAEICAYYERVMYGRLLPTGRVRFFPMTRYDGAQGHRLVSRLSGERFEVKVRKKLVDGRYLVNNVPGSTPPPFEVAQGARCSPVGSLVRQDNGQRFAIVGAGKTAMDACVWLLDSGVDPERMRWIKPRESWLQHRPFVQAGELIGRTVEGVARQLEAAAAASSIEDLFERLEEREQFLRVDREVTPTMYRGATMSEREVAQLRRITDVVRLGKVKRIGLDAIELDGGNVPTGPEWLHVHCATPALNPAPEVPIFQSDRIVLQSIRTGLLPFASAVTAYVEATRDDDAEKNRLCPPLRQPTAPAHWARGLINGMTAGQRWSQQPDIADWLERCRLNPGRGMRARGDDPEIREAKARLSKAAGPGLANLSKLPGVV